VSPFERCKRRLGKPHLRLVALAGVIVPRRLRADWRREWEAELQYREVMLGEWDRLDWRGKLDLTRRSASAFRDAVLLQPRRWEDEMVQDLRYGARMLRKNPGFTAVAALTLALGVGANTAIFSVVNAVLLRPLPYAKAEELAAMYVTPDGEARWPFSPDAYLNLKRRNTVFSGLAALSNKGWPVNLTGRGAPERLRGFQISSNLFPTLGVAPGRGRSFLAEEDKPGANRVVVISHELWRRFGADPGLVGQSLTLNGVPYNVIGVMPPDFRYFTKTDLWTPLAFTAADEGDSGNYLELIGRLKPGVGFERAGAEVDDIVRERRLDKSVELHARLDPPQSMMTREVRPMLLTLFAAVGFVLLIACVNLANLLLARGGVRRRELAIRSAMGAGRRRVIRQLLVESAILALIGGAGGLLLAGWGVRFLAGGLPEYLGDANAHVALLKLDTTALGFTLAVSLLTSLLFGLAPALQLSKVNLNEALKEGGRVAESRGRLRAALVVAEVAAAMVLLVGGGLTLKSFWKLAKVNPGYEPAGVLTAMIDPSGERYKEPVQINALYEDLLSRVAGIPGVRYAGVINSLNSSTPFSVAEHAPVPANREPVAQQNQASADYFKAMGIPLRAGRFFDSRDDKSAAPVVIIDESLARQVFPGENPVGKHLDFWKKSHEIVGVVGGARYWDLRHRPLPHIYVSYLQENWGSMSLVVRAQTGDPTRLTAPIRGALAAIDRNQPVHSFKTLEASFSELIAPEKFTTRLLAGFAALAAALAAIGIYGVMSYAVAQRTREIGVRMALGAQARDVLKAVLKQGMALVAAGAAIGLIASLWLTRLITDLLFGVKTTDAATLIAASSLLVAVALFACLVPARRATRIDPLRALREE
jgi:putative ABC transport system permease protein